MIMSAKPSERGRDRLALLDKTRTLHLRSRIVKRYGRDVKVGFRTEDVALIESRYRKLVETSDEPIILEIDCIGGSLNGAYHLSNLIKVSRVPIYALVTGDCLSAAFLVLQSCHYRYATIWAKIGFHNSYNMFYVDADTTQKEADRMAEELRRAPKEHRRDREKIIRNLKRRLTHMSRDDLLAMMRESKVMSAEVALRKRLVDEVVMN